MHSSASTATEEMHWDSERALQMASLRRSCVQPDHRTADALLCPLLLSTVGTYGRGLCLCCVQDQTDSGRTVLDAHARSDSLIRHIGAMHHARGKSGVDMPSPGSRVESHTPGRTVGRPLGSRILGQRMWQHDGAQARKHGCKNLDMSRHEAASMAFHPLERLAPCSGFCIQVDTSPSTPLFSRSPLPKTRDEAAHLLASARLLRAGTRPPQTLLPTHTVPGQ